MKTQKQQKEVTILNIYRFKNVSRICFEVLSSDETTKYHTCFDGSAEKSSCTCPGGQSFRGNCYHQDGLRARAALYFEGRQPQPEPELTAEDIADLVDPDIDATQPVKKVDPMTEAQQFIAKVQAEKAAREPETYLEKLHRLEREREERKRDAWKERSTLNRQEVKIEVAPSGRACPMR